MEPTEEVVKKRLAIAIDRFILEDGDLLCLDANERSITHKLAEHLQRQFRYWHVDCEYNRRGSETKRLARVGDEMDEPKKNDDEAKTVFPDIIIHRRDTSDNLLVIEIKKASGSGETNDKRKLNAFGESERYRYQHGLFLKLNTGDLEETVHEAIAEASYYRSGKEEGSWDEAIRERLERL